MKAPEVTHRKQKILLSRGFLFLLLLLFVPTHDQGIDQYTAIDDATRIRALQIYPEHNQVRAIQYINYMVEKFPFRISTIRTDREHEFQARFHWQVEDQGMRHVYIKPQTPQ